MLGCKDPRLHQDGYMQRTTFGWSGDLRPEFLSSDTLREGCLAHQDPRLHLDRVYYNKYLKSQII